VKINKIIAMKYIKILILVLPFATWGCDEQAFRSAFPPNGYFEPIFTVELKPDTLTYNGEFSHEYSGDYSISLSFERPNPKGYGYDIERLQVQCAFENATHITQLQCGNSLLEYWGDESGISIGLYNIPEAVRKHEIVSFSLEFQNSKELETIFETHGKISLIINKWSDL